MTASSGMRSTASESSRNHGLKQDIKDKLVLFTDGVTETDNGSGEQYGEERVKEFLKRNHSLTSSGFNNKLLKELNSFKTEKFYLWIRSDS